MIVGVSVALHAALLGVVATPDWTVKKLRFSAVTIGIAMKDHTTGWSSFTDGAHGVKMIKTTDGGSTWTPVQNQSLTVMVMGVATSTNPSLDVVTTGMMSTQHSSDGNVFKSSLFGPLVSQSIRAYDGKRVVSATEEGVYLSKNGGISYKFHAVPKKLLMTPGRYAAAPSDSVIYLTAGEWPSHANATAREVRLNSKLRITNSTYATGASRLAIETAEPSRVNGASPSPSNGYAAQILKSTDGGETWVSLFQDTGNFYFNEIDCVDETHCVAVGEGFGQDGSAAPGARVYTTTDGKTFTLTHSEADGSSLMAAKMLSTTEHVAGGRLVSGGVSLHSSDAGKTYAAQGTHIKGQAITSVSFVTPTHGFATAVNELQICSLLEFGAPPAEA